MMLHPKPLAKPFTVEQSISNASTKGINKEYLTLSGKTQDLIRKTNQGCSLSNEYKKLTGKRGYFGFTRIHPNKVSPVMLKDTAGLIHPIQNRTLSIGEYMRIASFPDGFILHGSFHSALQRMGNSVPPLFMRAISANIRNTLFNGEIPMKFDKNLTYPEILDLAWQEHLAPRANNAPTVISTFAGGGGSSLGYSMAGYKELLSVEWDDNAVQTFKLNFPNVPVYHGDIAKLSVEQCMKLAGLKDEGELYMLDGSPPCQGYSCAGKRDFNDIRNQLFREFVRLLRGLKPKVFVMENVSGLVKGKMKIIFAEIMRELKASGYQVKCQLMNTKYFYVPQSRQRLIFIGVRSDLDKEPSHPKAQSNPFGISYPETRTKTNKLNNETKQALINHKERHKAKGNGFGFRVMDKRKPSPAILKQFIIGNYPVYIDERNDYWLPSTFELKCIGSYPNDYRFPFDYKDTWERIGNSVHLYSCGPSPTTLNT